MFDTTIFGAGASSFTGSGSGSGSIIDKRGYVVTNVHVIENASVITISLADGSSYEGRVIGQDKESDIAVLKFDVPKGVELKQFRLETQML